MRAIVGRPTGTSSHLGRAALLRRPRVPHLQRARGDAHELRRPPVAARLPGAGARPGSLASRPTQGLVGASRRRRSSSPCSRRWRRGSTRTSSRPGGPAVRPHDPQRDVERARAHGRPPLVVARHPSGVEVLSSGVQEAEAGAVRRLLVTVEQRGVERATELVGGQIVGVRAAEDRRSVKLVKDAPDDRADARLGRGASTRCGRSGSAGEVEEVRALGVIELERPSERLQDKVRDAAEVPALQPLVVVHRDAGERGDLFPGAAPARGACRSSVSRPARA
jgi:hypothetical protein